MSDARRGRGLQPPWGAGRGRGPGTPGASVPEAEASQVFCLRWRSRGRTPRPKVLITNDTTHSPFPFGSSGEVRELKHLGLGLREGEERKKVIERRGAEAEEPTQRQG